MVDSIKLLESLRQKVRRIETAARRDSRRLSWGCAALDQLIPEGGLSTGAIHEWLSAGPGNGAEILSLIAAGRACADGGALVVVDAERNFYPPAAAAWGIQLEHTIVLRTATLRDTAWAIDQSLRCPAVAAVWGSLGAIDERWLRRFQLSAEQSGCLGLFIRPASVANQPSWCDARWHCQGLPLEPSSSIRHGRDRVPDVSSADFHDRQIQVQLLRVRGGRAGLTVTLRVDFNTGTIYEQPCHRQTLSLRLARQLADPKISRRAARA